MKKRKISRVPIKQITSMSDYDIHKLKAADQRRVLVSLNRQTNKRMSKLVEGLNKGKIDYGTIKEVTGVSSHIYKDQNGQYKYKRYTLAKNAPKYAMEAQIQNRQEFLGSKMSQVSKVQEVIKNRRAGLRKAYNEAMGYQPGDKGYLTRMTKKQYDKFGKLMKRLKDEKLLHPRSEEPYPEELKEAIKIMQERPRASVDEWYDQLMGYVEEEAAEKKAQDEALLKSLLGL